MLRPEPEPNLARCGAAAQEACCIGPHADAQTDAVRPDEAAHRPLLPGGVVTLRQAAQLLGGVTESCLRAWIRSGRLRARKLPGRNGRYIIARADLEALIGGGA